MITITNAVILLTLAVSCSVWITSMIWYRKLLENQEATYDRAWTDSREILKTVLAAHGLNVPEMEGDE